MEQTKVTDLIPDSGNANKGTERGAAQLEISLRKYGAGRSIVLDKHNRIIAGNKTVENAAAIGLDDVIVVETTGDKLVAVKRTDLDLTDDSTGARALAYADNRVAQVGLDWDAGVMLADINAGVDVGDFFREEELAELLADVMPQETEGDTEPQIDRAEELCEKWGVETGQMWQLGEHHIICGDCTDEAVVARVMGGETYNTLIYDPEWDNIIPITPSGDNVLAFADGQRAKDIIDLFGSPTWIFSWDCVTSWYTPNRPLKRQKLSLWYGDIDTYNFDGAHYGNAGDVRPVKNTRGAYAFHPDPRGKHLSDMYQFPITRLHNGNIHSHSKPLEWVQMLIANCTTGIVFDPFSGSGTTIIACENLGRKCRAIEIDAGYVAVAIERWSEHTGKTPVLVE